MIKFILGPKGSGKTKFMLDSIAEAVKNSTGYVVAVERGQTMYYDIDHSVRLIDIDEYDISNYDSFYGFLAGLMAGNYDIYRYLYRRLLQDRGPRLRSLRKMIDKLIRLTDDLTPRRVRPLLREDESAGAHPQIHHRAVKSKRKISLWGLSRREIFCLSAYGFLISFAGRLGIMKKILIVDWEMWERGREGCPKGTGHGGVRYPPQKCGASGEFRHTCVREVTELPEPRMRRSSAFRRSFLPTVPPLLSLGIPTADSFDMHDGFRTEGKAWPLAKKIRRRLDRRRLGTRPRFRGAREMEASFPEGETVTDFGR
jgi:hypothetical protein